MKNLKFSMINVALIAVLYLIFFVLIKTKTINNYQQGIIILIMINIILAVSLNLVTGFLGQLTLGHAGFMAIGAYTAALFSKSGIFPEPIAFPVLLIIGGLFAAIVGVLIGIPALRLKGDYIAILTLGFGEIIRGLIIYFKDLTGGAKGLFGITHYSNFTNVFFILMFTIFVIFTLIHSRHGRAIVAIREDEIAAEASGINIVYYKIFAFTVSAFFAGVAGVLFVFHQGMLDPGKFNYNYSIEMLIMVVFGGMGSITGSILSTIVLTAIPEFLSSLARYRMLIYSILLIIIMIFKPSGLLGKYEFSLKRFVAKFNGKKG